MGRKGDKLTAESTALVEKLLVRLQGLGDVRAQKMFGGYGLFGHGKMFGLVTSGAELFLKADDSNIAQFRKARAPQHGKMPYYRVPKRVLNYTAALLEWARRSLRVAHG